MGSDHLNRLIDAHVGPAVVGTDLMRAMGESVGDRIALEELAISRGEVPNEDLADVQ